MDIQGGGSRVRHSFEEGHEGHLPVSSRASGNEVIRNLLAKAFPGFCLREGCLDLRVA